MSNVPREILSEIETEAGWHALAYYVAAYTGKPGRMTDADHPLRWIKLDAAKRSPLGSVATIAQVAGRNLYAIGQRGRP